MRLCVGTLYSNENEFDECVQSIETQNYREFTHFIYKYLPKKEAHDTLFGSFVEKSNQFDLLVKIDADMVLTDPDFFEKVVDKFSIHPWLEHLEIAVHDFFSDQLIWGLHIYRNTFQWQKGNENLFTDLVHSDGARKLSDDQDLAPAAIHCKNPGRFQSFHYGVHKAVKMMQPARADKKQSHSKYHWDIIQKTWNHFLESRDDRLGLAVLGAEFAFYHKLQPLHLDYTNSFCRDHFSECKNYDFNRVLKEIKRIRKWNWGILPADLRREVLGYLEGGHMLQARSLIRLSNGVSKYLKRRLLG